MFNSQSYGKWQQMLWQLIPDQCESRLLNLTWLIVGIFVSKSVYTSMIARHLPIRANKLSIAKRLERFMSNKAVDVESWYHPWASWLLESASVGSVIHLVIDSTKVSAYCRQIMVSVAYQRRTLPIMWDWVEYPRGHAKTCLQIDLLKRLYPYLPEGVQVSLVGDSEFGASELIGLLQEWGWDYALRQKGNILFQHRGSTGWQRLDSIDLKRGDTLWFGNIKLSETHARATHLVMHWKPGEKAPWYLATNRLSGFPTIRLYKRRMWIEEMFGDMKGHGFDLELSRFRTPDRLSRLTLAVCILYVWLVTIGEYVLKQGLSGEIDRKDRQDLSIFRLGWDWLERRFVFNDPFPILFRPNFCLVSGR